MSDPLTAEERQVLLQIARQAMEAAVRGKRLPRLDLDSLSSRLRQKEASFVTLTIHGALRGCIGALEPSVPLAEDVRQHAVAAALQDYRFLPVDAAELPYINIEISRLTIPQPLEYKSPDELIKKLIVGEDGVILMDSGRKATFLPQVWEKLPNPVDFLEHLCQKMGAPADLWRRKSLQVYIYHVEEFHE